MEREVTKRVGIIGAGNIAGLSHALNDAGAATVVVGSTTALCIPDPDALVLPGVGHFAYCARELEERGYWETVKAWAASGKPLLGVCVGMQLLFEESEEGPAKGLGILPGRVQRLYAKRLPHVGWNEVDGDHFYFAHSYAVPHDYRYKSRSSFAYIQSADYEGNVFVAHIRDGKVWGTQFHPEKSGTAGVDFLRRWVESI